jgi:anti-sigma factor RsiW
MADVDHAAYEQDFSDYYDGTLAAARAAEVKSHLDSCARCQAEYERFRGAVSTLSGLKRASAPKHFDEKVAQTINRRSAGRFFGRRAFGDRIPYEVLGLLALAAVATLIILLRYGLLG